MYLVIQHRVRDYGQWKPVFDEHEDVRRRHGGTKHWLHRSVDDPNEVVVVTEFASRRDAESFLADESLRPAMARAGVEGEPELAFRELVEERDY